MDYEQKIKALKDFLKEIGIELMPVETSGGALIVVSDVESGIEIGYKKL